MKTRFLHNLVPLTLVMTLCSSTMLSGGFNSEYSWGDIVLGYGIAGPTVGFFFSYLYEQIALDRTVAQLNSSLREALVLSERLDALKVRLGADVTSSQFSSGLFQEYSQTLDCVMSLIHTAFATIRQELVLYDPASSLGTYYQSMHEQWMVLYQGVETSHRVHERVLRDSYAIYQDCMRCMRIISQHGGRYKDAAAFVALGQQSERALYTNCNEILLCHKKLLALKVLSMQLNLPESLYPSTWQETLNQLIHMIHTHELIARIMQEDEQKAIDDERIKHEQARIQLAKQENDRLAIELLGLRSLVAQLRCSVDMLKHHNYQLRNPSTPPAYVHNYQ